MADSIKITTLCTAIASLSITVTSASGASGALTIRDISAITEAVNQQDCPLLVPRAGGFVTDFSVTRDTFGADAALKTASYTLTYVLYFCPVGQGAGLFEKYDEMVTAAAIILNALANNTALSGSTDILPAAVPRFGQVTDALGTEFHGCEIAMRVTQFMEV